MKPFPFFSIIIPTYNRAHLILKTLNSIFTQTCSDYEIIVVDNCSTDNTSEILKPFVDEEKLVFIRHDKNYERAVSRNTGINHAKGNYITFLDSDDLMYPTNLEDALNYTVDNPSKKVFHNLYEITSVTGERKYIPSFPAVSNAAWAITNGNFLSCIGVFIHADIYKTILFDTDPVLVGSEDYEFWLRVIARCGKIGRINKVNNAIIEHSERTVNAGVDIQKMEKRFDYLLNKISKDGLMLSVYGKYLPRMKASLKLYTAAMLNIHGSHKEALEYLGYSFREDATIIFTFRFWRILQIAISRGLF